MTPERETELRRWYKDPYVCHTSLAKNRALEALDEVARLRAEVWDAKARLLTAFVPRDERGPASEHALARVVQHAIEHHNWHHDALDARYVQVVEEDRDKAEASLAGIRADLREVLGWLERPSLTLDSRIEHAIDIVRAMLEGFPKPSGEGTGQTGPGPVDPREGNAGDIPRTTGGDASASPARVWCERCGAMVNGTPCPEGR